MNDDPMDELPTIGTRLNFGGHIGTVKYVGNVDNTKGAWLGVEWDKPERGKHDGVRDGKRYFACRIPNSGSFIRPSTSISYGISFLEALRSKYVELLHGDKETVLLGSSHGAIVVEAVNLDKIRRKLSDLQSLREASLDGENVAGSDPQGEIRRTCSMILGLNLSASLISSWDTIAGITSELPLLERLALNRNRFLPPNDTIAAYSAFQSLKELQLNKTLITWSHMQEITVHMPKLEVVELGHNLLCWLAPSTSQSPLKSTITSLNLDSNECCDWSHICQTLRQYSSLERVVLASNRINEIPFVKDQDAPLTSLRILSLSFNGIKTWYDIDRLSFWCPSLENLTLAGNPLFDDPVHSKFARQLTIAKIPSLLTLDATVISPKERENCELFYISYISKSVPFVEEEISRQHPRWRELLAKHNMTDVVLARKDISEKLSNRLIEVNVHKCTTMPSSRQLEAYEQIPPASLRVLPTMPTRIFRQKISKTFKVIGSKHVDMWLRMNDDTLVEMAPNDDDRDLSWWGIENGSNIFVYFE